MIHVFILFFYSLNPSLHLCSIFIFCPLHSYLHRAYCLSSIYTREYIYCPTRDHVFTPEPEETTTRAIERITVK